MLIKYYKNSEQYNINYTSRNRFLSIPVSPFYQEEQRSIKLGDGAETQIKTSVDNICDYVTIDDTRWFVTSYVYLNGKQVVLNLQRDVIGEFGLSNCFGKIERGYTETFLRNRKELELNQILKKRIPLIPDMDTYGNYTVNTHKKEMWGVIYLTKPADGQVVIPIPEFTYNHVDYPMIDNNSTYITDIASGCDIEFNVIFNVNDINGNYTQNSGYSIKIHFDNAGGNWQLGNSSIDEIVRNGNKCIIMYTLSTIPEFMRKQFCQGIIKFIVDRLTYITYTTDPIVFPKIDNLSFLYQDYNNAIIKDEDKYFRYSTDDTVKDIYGSFSTDDNAWLSFFKEIFVGKSFNFPGFSGGSYDVYDIGIYGGNNRKLVVGNSVVKERITTVSRTEISASEAGVFTIDVNNQNLIDEPYYILVCPLYDVNISGGGIYNISRDKAFNAFNNVIQTLSGENGYLVDAQIYPYCPTLTSVTAEIDGIPFFTVASTSFERNCVVQLLPSSDIKKEYIEREYSIVSPEQSSKFTFNFYDYVNTITDNDGVNYAQLRISIKSALKPFSIIASAVIIPEIDSLMNMTYDSDLRGSQPTSNGFECSLASNAFETYRRQNSNYQQIFNREQETLKKQHQVELKNENVATVMNTLSATVMGSVAGGNMADVGIGNFFGAKAVGAVAGGAAAGLTVGTAMSIQKSENEKLRRYEEDTQRFMFDMNIGTIKNLPNSINRISTVNEIILKDFWFQIEVYECSSAEKSIVDNFINNYSYSIGVFDYVSNYVKNGWFIRSTLVKSGYAVNLHNIASNELKGGIYYYEQV